MKQEAQGVEIINAMSREDFHQKVIRGFGRSNAFGGLVSFGAKNILPEERQQIRAELANIGIPLALTESDKDLDDIASAIAGRSVSLR